MDRQSTITRDYIDSVQSLVYSADANYLICASLYRKLNQQDKSDYNRFALITANNAFDSSVITLRSLIESTDKNEFRIEPVIDSILNEKRVSTDGCKLSCDAKVYKEKVVQMYPEDDFDYLISLGTSNVYPGEVIKCLKSEIVEKSSRADLNNLRNKFSEKGLLKIRHLVSAHKNKNVQYVTKTSSSWLDSRHITDLGEIIKDTRLLSYFLCGYELHNRVAQECISSIPQSLS